MAKKTTKFNVGDKVRIIDVDEIMFGSERWNNGDITEVVGFHGGDADNPKMRCTRGHYKGMSFTIHSKEFHAIEKVSEDSPQLSDEIEELKRRVTELEAKLAVEETPKSIGTLDAIHFPLGSSEWKWTPAKTPNELRKQAIEKAKKFVEDTEELTEDGKYSIRERKGFNFASFVTRPEFIVNEEKRTVVALIKGRVISILLGKGIAKCAPSDVFNADIGKAIALGRAYGLDTSDFELAPQPDEVVAGMKVEVNGLFEPYEDTASYEDFQRHNVDVLREKPDYLRRIISDTEAQY